MNDLHDGAVWQKVTAFIAHVVAGGFTKVMSYVTYAMSGGLIVGDTMDWLNANASAMGVLIGLATFATNFYFRWKGSRNGVIEHGRHKD